MTDRQRWLSKRYVAYRALTNMWFMGAVWLYFYRLFITDQQVGILDGMAFAIGLVAEVPSGALADRIGRNHAVRIGQGLVAGGLLLQGLGSDFLPLFIGQAILMIGVALVSGADEALFFENLNFPRGSLDWRKLVTRGGQVALSASVVAYVLGGWMHTINPRIPWFMTAAAFLGSALLIWSIKDTRPRRGSQSFGSEVRHYLGDIRTGFAQFNTPGLRVYLPVILAVQGLFYAFGYGLLRLVLLDRFDFSPFWGSLVVASASVITVGVLAFMHRKADKLREKHVVLSVGTLAAASLLLSLADIGPWGYVVILALHAGEHVLYPFMSEILNTHAPQDKRATVLSVASFLRSLPYVALAPLIGVLSTRNDIEYFLTGWALVIVAALTVYLVATKSDRLVKVSSNA